MKRILSTLAFTAMMATSAYAQNIGVHVEGDNTNVTVIVETNPSFAQETWVCHVRWWKPRGKTSDLFIKYEISLNAGQYREYHDYGSGFERKRQARFEYDTSSKIVFQNGNGTSNSEYEALSRKYGVMHFDSGDNHQRGNCQKIAGQNEDLIFIRALPTSW